MEMGRPSLVAPAGTTTAGRLVMVLTGFIAEAAVVFAERRCRERFEGVHQRVHLMAVHQIHDEPAHGQAVLETSEIPCVEDERLDAEGEIS
jgi:hypothetical protein